MDDRDTFFTDNRLAALIFELEREPATGVFAEADQRGTLQVDLGVSYHGHTEGEEVRSALTHEPLSEGDAGVEARRRLSFTPRTGEDEDAHLVDGAVLGGEDEPLAGRRRNVLHAPNLWRGLDLVLVDLWPVSDFRRLHGVL